MIIRRTNVKRKKILKILLILFCIQTVLFIPISPLLSLNMFKSLESTELNYERLEEQKELFQMPVSWFLFGPWAGLVLVQIKSDQQHMIETGIKEGDDFVPIWKR